LSAFFNVLHHHQHSILTNVAAPEGTHAPMGQIIKLREYPNASFKDVTAPNAETLYTTSFFDVGKEPWVLSIPDQSHALPTRDLPAS
jgi:hypothetical protein